MAEATTPRPTAQLKRVAPTKHLCAGWHCLRPAGASALETTGVIPVFLLMIVPNTWNVPEAIRVRVGKTTYGRQRAIFEEGHLLLVLHQPPASAESKRAGELFWRTPAGEWHWNHGASTPAALKRHLQSYADLEDKIGDEYDDAMNLRTLFDVLEKLVPLARAARNQHAALQAAREAVKGDPLLVELRDLAYDLERGFDLLLEDVRNTIAYRTAREAEEQARVSQAALRASHRLNVLAALFFPLTALASLFGMNLAHGLNLNSPAIFWGIFAGSVVVGLGILGWVLRRPADLTPPPKKKR